MADTDSYGLLMGEA